MSAPFRNRVLVGDALDRLRRLPSASVDCVVTSPPYFQLRDYGVDGQLGLEPTVHNWVDALRQVFAEVARVLTPTGTLWLNLDDSYSSRHHYGSPPKSLFLAPERLLLALAGDGWVARNKIVWAKPTPMPTGVADRFDTAHELVYLLARSRRYFFDLDAVRSVRVNPSGEQRLGRGPTDVWTISSRRNRQHAATFPDELARRAVLAGCPEAVCTRCGQPWRRAVQIERHHQRPSNIVGTSDVAHVRRYRAHWTTLRRRGDLQPCGCNAPTRPGLVLDPFLGSGTTAVVATEQGRDWVGIELNPAYAAIAKQRITAAQRERSNPGVKAGDPKQPRAA